MVRALRQILSSGPFPKAWSVDLNLLGVSWQKGLDGPVSLEKAHAVFLLGIHNAPYQIKGSTKPCNQETYLPQDSLYLTI